jgi:monoamine oxidase
MGRKLEFEVAVIGAGAAGLAAVAALRNAGKHVICLEGSSRIGGRILTSHDPLCGVPIELGAEFVHGRSPEVFDLAAREHLPLYEHSSKAQYLHRGRIAARTEPESAADKLLGRVSAFNRIEGDRTLSDVERRSKQSPLIRKRAVAQIEGFNAARAVEVSVAALLRDSAAAERISGDLAYRILTGYNSVVSILLREAGERNVLREHVVERVQWKPGRVVLTGVRTVDAVKFELICRQVVVTVPLGVLQEGRGLIFDPLPRDVARAFGQLGFGKVYRFTFVFHERFWERDKRLRHAGFLIDLDQAFPAWWTTNPVIAPVLTAWAGGSAADRLSASTNGERAALVGLALQSLKAMLGRTVPDPAGVHFHDWDADPFCRGAYSYVKVNGTRARAVLRRPINRTLYFAGEATAADGGGGTVHGAIESGQRAAADLISQA